MDLFTAYRGHVLDVSLETDALLRKLYPEVDRQSAYRDADGWLVTCPRSRWPRNTRRFLINFFKNEKRIGKGTEQEIHVGAGPLARDAEAGKEKR
jgi:hypothetical protein